MFSTTRLNNIFEVPNNNYSQNSIPPTDPIAELQVLGHVMLDRQDNIKYTMLSIMYQSAQMPPSSKSKAASPFHIEFMNNKREIPTKFEEEVVKSKKS